MADEFEFTTEEEELDPVIEQGTDVLPPAGDEQREILQKRKDRLEKLAEEVAERSETYTFDPRQFEIENEIGQHFNALEVTDKQPGFRYAWVNYQAVHGRGVTYKLAKRAKGQPVWEVVRGDMPECLEQKAVDGTRRIGDVLLMRAKLDLVRLLDEHERLKRLAQQDAIDSNLFEMGDRYARHGVRVYNEGEMDPRLLNSVQSRAHAKQTAARMTDKWIRQGSMPGSRARR